MEKFLIGNKTNSDSISTATTSTNVVRSRAPSLTRDCSVLDDEDVEKSKREKNKSCRKISFVWKYFKRSGGKKYAKCLTCGNEYKTSGNTSNLLDHLKRFHPFLKKQEQTLLPRSGNGVDVSLITENEDSVGSFSCSSSRSTSARSSMRSLSPSLRKIDIYDDSSPRKKELDRALVHMIVKDFQPFTIVNDTGFTRFVKLLDPRYKLPSTYTLSDKMLKTAYVDAYNKLKLELSSVEYLAVTCDSWTSVTTESYLTVTCHYVKDFNLRSAVLSTKPLENINHTSENISNTLKDIFVEWEISMKVLCIVTDNASNMKKACELIEKRHLPCFAHSLNLVVQECLTLESIQPVIKKVKEIVTFFKSSHVAMETFKQEQDTSEPLKLLQDVPTRWNSTFLMIQRILKVNNALSRAILKLRKAPTPLSVDEITILTDIEKILSCFDEATKKISGSTYVTISLVIPLTMGIYSFLTKCFSEVATNEGKSLCTYLLESVKKRLYHYESRTVTKLGTILDPRFKQEGFQNPGNATSASMLLEQEMCGLLRKQSSTTSNLNSLEEPISAVPSLFGFLKERINNKSRSITADVIVTKRQYLERVNSSENTDPLQFWKFAEKELTPMEECAKKYFCIPATSVESERSFSTAGLIVSD